MVRLAVDGVTFVACPLILSARSDYFAAMFRKGRWQECPVRLMNLSLGRGQGQKMLPPPPPEIMLGAGPTSVFKAVLDYLYADSLAPASRHDLDMGLQLARWSIFFGVRGLLEHCVTVIRNHHLTADSVCK